MKITHRASRGLIASGLGWALFITVLRAARLPNDWAEAHWLISYQFGFVKRALPGTLLKPFIDRIAISSTAVIITVVSSLIFLILMAVLFLLMLHILKNQKYDLGCIIFSLAFATSPYVVMCAHINGYYDHLVVLLTIVSCWLALTNRPLPAAMVLAVGIFVHETILIIGLPTVLFASLLRCFLERKSNGSKLNLSRDLFKSALPYALPLTSFLTLFITQMFILDPVQVRAQLITHLLKYEFVEWGRSYLVPNTFTTSFLKHLFRESPFFPDRLFDLYWWLPIIPTLAVLIFYIKMRFTQTKKIGLVVIATCISIIPLLLHAIAWDTMRIWTYPLVVTFLLIWCISELINPQVKHIPWTHPFSLIGLCVIFMNFFFVIPLMDGEIDRFPNCLRVIWYTPVLILISSGLVLQGRKEAEPVVSP